MGNHFLCIGFNSEPIEDNLCSWWRLREHDGHPKDESISAFLAEDEASCKIFLKLEMKSTSVVISHQVWDLYKKSLYYNVMHVCFSFDMMCFVITFFFMKSLECVELILAISIQKIAFSYDLEFRIKLSRDFSWLEFIALFINVYQRGTQNHRVVILAISDRFGSVQVLKLRPFFKNWPCCSWNTTHAFSWRRAEHTVRNVKTKTGSFQSQHSRKRNLIHGCRRSIVLQFICYYSHRVRLQTSILILL